MDEINSEISVRRARGEDLDTIVAFNAAMALETEGKTLDRATLRSGVAAVLQRGALGFYLIAEVGEALAGQLLITTEWSDWRNAYFWWIQSVYVAEEHRRKGVYRALDRSVRAEARREGNVCGVRLYVDRSNHTAQQVYANLGMSPSHYHLYEVEF